MPLPAKEELIKYIKNILERVEEKISAERLVVDKLARRYDAHPHQVARYLELFGSTHEVEEFLATTEKDVMRTIRVNTLLVSRDGLLKMLREKGVVAAPYTPTPYGIIVFYSPIAIGALHEYLYGYYIVQGPASMLPVLILDPTNRDRVIDMCAGAGAKTTQIAQHAPKARIYAIDLNKRKLLALKNHASRMHVYNIIGLQHDARYIDFLGYFTKILLDAPCSGEGLWPFKKKRRKRNFADIVSRVLLQAELLYSALRIAKPGSEIVYATCTISVEENELLINSFLDKVNNVRLKPIDNINFGESGVTDYAGLSLEDQLRYCKRFYPHRHRTEGFTVCRMIRTE